MAKKEQNQPQVQKDESQVVQQEILQTDANLLSEAINQDTDALMRVAEKLDKASQNFYQQQTGLKQMLKMQGDLKEVLSQVIQGMEKSSISSALYQENVATPFMQPVNKVSHYSETKQQRDECGCDCIETGCCCFEIVLDKVRAIQPQIEPADSGDVPGLHNPLEVQIFASIDKQGILVPGISTALSLPVGSVLLGGKPGAWISIDRVIKRVSLRKGATQNITVDFEVAEIDKGLERPAGMKDEYGEASGHITLDCCVSKIFPQMPTDLSFEHGGTGGGAPGMISLAFYARRICC